MELSNLPDSYWEILTSVVSGLRKTLGKNLYSCILYGSAVRSSFVAGSSDLNLLIILNESTPAAHREISRILKRKVRIEPFVICRVGMEKSFDAFAIKFCSIKRHYQVLHGEDPLSDLVIDEKILYFVTEQALRNLRLRTVRAYINQSHDRQRYLGYLAQITPQVFTDIGTALRVRGFPVEKNFADRIPLLTEHLGDSAQVLKDLLDLKKKKVMLSEEELFLLHSKLFTLLDQTISWLSE
jgi:predicted nucleotidyltransferase